MQKNENLVDLVKSFPTNIYLQNLASIQKRTSPKKFAHLAEKSEKGSISNLSTKVINDRLCELEGEDGETISLSDGETTTKDDDVTMKEDERFVDAVDFCACMFDWHVIKEQFKQRGVNVTGPDKHVVMSRVIAAYRSSKEQEGE